MKRARWFGDELFTERFEKDIYYITEECSNF
jgi:hypothetical protein